MSLEDVGATAVEQAPESRFLNRELSRLDFDRRVLAQAADPSVPLLERVRFCSIVSSNLDEFFMVRVAGLLRQAAAGVPARSADGRTPRAALDEIRGLSAKIARLRALGFRIAVDDLGAGYAGLSTFAALEPDVIKADMSLVRGIETSSIKQKLIAAIATLANDLRINLVAEGIETPAERDCVVALGAHALQGYLFARPGRGFPSISA